MNSELLAVVNYLERERGVDRAVIIQVIGDALQAVAKKSAGISEAVRVEVDPKSLNMRIIDRARVTETFERTPGTIPQRRARLLAKDAKVGDEIDVPIPFERLGRIGAQSVRQMILQKIREAVNQKVFEDYQDRVGTIVTGTVRAINRRDVIVDLGDNAEALLSSRDRIAGDDFQVGDQVRAYLKAVRGGRGKGEQGREEREPQSGPAILLSRTCGEFLKELFRSEVSEVYEGIVEIRAVARDPGYRAKVAVFTHDDKVDPVGACVGMRGARVRNIVRELDGEKIDIVRWNEDPRIFVAQALAPARLESVEEDPNRPGVMIVNVEEDQYSLAIGRRGQNIRLTEKLTGYRLDVRRTGADVPFEEQVAQTVQRLASIPGITTDEARVLVKNGFLTPDGILAAEIPYIQEATGFDEPVAHRIWNAAAAASDH
ncbi:MAG: transcription termination factor NusA [Kiritimatiellia bacterium]|jgi:N utilization substance protein A